MIRAQAVDEGRRVIAIFLDRGEKVIIFPEGMSSIGGGNQLHAAISGTRPPA